MAIQTLSLEYRLGSIPSALIKKRATLQTILLSTTLAPRIGYIVPLEIGFIQLTTRALGLSYVRAQFYCWLGQKLF